MEFAPADPQPCPGLGGGLTQYAGSIMGDGYNSPPTDKTASEMMAACKHTQH